MRTDTKAKVEFQPVKPLIGSIVVAERADYFDPDVVRQCLERLEERAVLILPSVNFTDAEQLAFTGLMGGRLNLTSSAQPDFMYQHHWQDGDFVIWSNTGALHRVVPYARDSGRMMHRTSIAA